MAINTTCGGGDGAGYGGTLTSIVPIGMGSKTFNIETGLAWLPGGRVRIADLTDPTTKYMEGIITSYSGTVLIAEIDITAGSGDLQVGSTVNPTGLTGDSYYIYIGYAEDDNGTNYSPTPAADLHYIAFLKSTVEIPTPMQSDFTGLWEKYIGENAFIYIGYAEDDSGTGYSPTPAPALTYIAFLNSTVEIPTPAAGDFSGLWEKYIGTDGNLLSSGTAAPDNGDGTDGDYYFRYFDLALTIYKKTSGAWVVDSTSPIAMYVAGELKLMLTAGDPYAGWTLESGITPPLGAGTYSWFSKNS